LRSLFATGLFAVSLVVIFLLRRTSWEGKFLLIFGMLALSAFLRLHFYLLLFTALSLFAFVGVALLWAKIATIGLKITREVKKEALVGENVPVHFKIDSLAPFALYHARVWDRAGRNRSGGGQELVQFEDPGYVGFLRFDRQEASEATLHIIPPVRGLMNFGPVGIEGGDPFGIFNFVTWFPVGGECLVLPTWVKLSAFPSIPARLSIREQNRPISREGQSHELLGVRAYSEGDSLRRVHWPLTARHDELIVRQFEREVEEETLVILDADRVADVGEGAENALEYLIMLATSLIHSAGDTGRPWALVIAGPTIETFSNKTKDSALNVEYALAKLQPRHAGPIEQFLDSIRKEYPDSACLLLTARTDSGPSIALARGDARIGEDARSMIVKVDPLSFVSTIDERSKTRKRQRLEPEADPRPPEASGSSIAEITLTRGESIADVFLARGFA
jgi:uncharacterized protein (DUF58 family)